MRSGTHPFGPHPLLPPALGASSPVPRLAVPPNLPGVPGGAPLLPVPVVVPPKVHRNHEQLRLFWILSPDTAAQKMLMQDLQATLACCHNAQRSCLSESRRAAQFCMICWHAPAAERALVLELYLDLLCKACGGTAPGTEDSCHAVNIRAPRGPHNTVAYLIIVILIRVPLRRQLLNLCRKFCRHVIHMDESLCRSLPSDPTATGMCVFVSHLGYALLPYIFFCRMAPC